VLIYKEALGFSYAREGEENRVRKYE